MAKESEVDIDRDQLTHLGFFFCWHDQVYSLYSIRQFSVYILDIKVKHIGTSSIPGLAGAVLLTAM